MDDADNSDEEWAHIVELVTEIEKSHGQQSGNQPAGNLGQVASTHPLTPPMGPPFPSTQSPVPPVAWHELSSHIPHVWQPTSTKLNSTQHRHLPQPHSSTHQITTSRQNDNSRRPPQPRQSPLPHHPQSSPYTPSSTHAHQRSYSPHPPSSTSPPPPPSSSLPPRPPAPSLGSALSARELETTGQLANYRRKVSAMERELAHLRSRGAPPSISSTPGDAVETMRLELEASRTAQRRMQERLVFAERELEMRNEASDFVEATQAPATQTLSSQAPASQFPPSQLPSSQHPSSARRSRGISMSRITPRAPKRRRSSSSTLNYKSPPSIRPSSRPSSAASSADPRDWPVADAAWWAAYDAPDRVAARARAGVFAPPRANALLALSSGRGGAELRAALAAALGGGGKDVWIKLHDALLSASTIAGPGTARRAALGAVLSIHLSFPVGIGKDAQARANAGARRVLSEEGNDDADVALKLLAIVGDSGAYVPGKREERALRDALAACSVDGAEACAAMVRSFIRAGDEGIPVAERLCKAALDAVPHGGIQFNTAALAIVERVTAVAPFEAQRSGSLLTLLDCPINSQRAARIIADAGAADAPPAALARAITVLRDRKHEQDRGSAGMVNGIALDGGNIERSKNETAETQALTRILSAWCAFSDNQGDA